MTALSRGDVIAMQEVVSLHQEEMVRGFFLLLREAASALERSPNDPEEHEKARLLIYAAAQLAETFAGVGLRGNLLYRQFQDSPRLTSTVQSAVFSDVSLARFLSQRARELPDLGAEGEVSLAADLRSIFDAAVESSRAPNRRTWESEAHARNMGLQLGFAIVALVLLGLFLRRHWTWSGAKLELAPGGRARLSRGLWQRRQRQVEPGTILHTAWARDVLGRRRRIKMEVLASMGPAPANEPPGTAFDVLVAAGASIPPGTYLAVAPAGIVKIRVTPGL